MSSSDRSAATDRAVTRPGRLPLNLSAPENDRFAIHLVYALYSAAIVFGIPVFLGVLLAYLKRQDVEGTELESHVGWQIRTFWIWLAFWAIGSFCVLTFILIPIGWVLLGFGQLWLVYRVVKGWVVHSNERPIRAPGDFW
mmetsp:Transcript_146213/g.207301  ORF Transcript_146213/g.207301 Transcript_146213/m.207301 type:complete len:140 (-) Transcript_146213:145-564(-)